MTDHVKDAEEFITDTDHLIELQGRGVNLPNEILATATQAYAHATLALVEVTERLAVAQETANLLTFSAHIDDMVKSGAIPSRVVTDRAVAAGQQAVKAMGL